MHTTTRISHKDHKTMARIQVHMLNSNQDNNRAPILTKDHQAAIHMHQIGHHSKKKSKICWQSAEAQKSLDILKFFIFQIQHRTPSTFVMTIYFFWWMV